MVLVVLSGVVGRFFCLQIPRTIQGQEIDISELIKMRNELSEKLSSEIIFDKSLVDDLTMITSPERYKNITFLNAAGFFIKDAINVREFKRKIIHHLRKAGITKFRNN